MGLQEVQVLCTDARKNYRSYKTFNVKSLTNGSLQNKKFRKYKI